MTDKERETLLLLLTSIEHSLRLIAATLTKALEQVDGESKKGG